MNVNGWKNMKKNEKKIFNFLASTGLLLFIEDFLLFSGFLNDDGQLSLESMSNFDDPIRY